MHYSEFKVLKLENSIPISVIIFHTEAKNNQWGHLFDNSICKSSYDVFNYKNAFELSNPYSETLSFHGGGWN